MKKYFFLAAVAALAFVSCNDDNKGNNPSGKTEVNVAKADLVAYFPMENNQEKTSNLNLSSSSTAKDSEFVAGRCGKCYQGGTGSYLLYDANDAIKSMTEFTLSMWVKQIEIPSDHAPVPMYFQLATPNDHFWGALSMSVDRTDVGAGYLKYKTCFFQGDKGSVWKTWTDDYADCFPAGRWNHIIYTYSASSSEFHVYVNGTDVTPEAAVACVLADAPAGALNFSEVNMVNIGAWMPKVLDGATDEWMGDFNNEAQIDEVRLYKRGLTAAEAKELYLAEVANVD